MEERIRLRQEHGSLVRAGKLEEARRVMVKIKGRVKLAGEPVVEEIKEKPVVEVPVEEPKKVIKEKGNPLDKLTKINGIGKKTVKDIKVMFKDVNALIVALKEDRVPLRDDVVLKLKEELIE